MKGRMTAESYINRLSTNRYYSKIAVLRYKYDWVSVYLALDGNT